MRPASSFARHSIVNLKRLFFDRKAVLRAVDAATRRTLSRAGAYVRAAARKSVRSRAGTSKSGHAPHSHTGLLKRFIFFAYDPSARSVIIGPARLRGRGYGEAPALLELGGRASWTVNGRGGRTYHPRYKARPYMGPALKRSQRALPDLWANSVKPG